MNISFGEWMFIGVLFFVASAFAEKVVTIIQQKWNKKHDTNSRNK